MIVYDPDPQINERIRRAVRYGQTRWAEIWLSIIAVGVGLILLGPTETFSNPSFRVIASVIDEKPAGGLCVFFGGLRLAALWINGRRGRETSIIRTFGCIGGFFFWLAIAVGMMLAVPPLSTGIAVYSVLAMAELHASGRAAGDMAAEDSFGIRKRRRRDARSHTAPATDSWPAILAAGAAAIAAVLVPLNGFVKTLLDYKAEARKAEALKPETAREIASSNNCNQLFDSMALSDLAAAVKGLTSAIAADTASEEAHHASHLSEVLTRVTQVLDRQDEREPPPRRGSR